MTSTCRSIDLAYAAVSDRGQVREENQDRWFADAEAGLFVVADGMGGLAAGSLAAQLTVELFPRLALPVIGPALPTPELAVELSQCVSRLSTLVREETQGQPGISGLGSTVAAVVVHGSDAIVINAGDTRVYRLKQGRLDQLTKDHTVAEMLLEEGQADAACPPDGSAKHQLTRFVGMPGQLIPDWTTVEFKPGDMLLMCSDGLHGTVGNESLAELSQIDGDLQFTGKRLVEAANMAGGKDNITAVLVRRQRCPDADVPRAMK